MKIIPSIGRIMWYWTEADDRSNQPEAAIVTLVHNEDTVNLTVFRANGDIDSVFSVPIVQEGSPNVVGDSSYVEWMPYQVGQAKKHEADKA